MTDDRIRSCEDALRLLATYLDGELDGDTRREVDRHLSTCRSCYSRSEFELGLKDQLGLLGSEAPPPRLRDRVQTLIHRFGVSQGG